MIRSPQYDLPSSLRGGAALWDTHAGQIVEADYFASPPPATGATLRAHTAGGWVSAPLRRFDGAAWVSVSLSRWSGSAWQPV